MPIFNVEINKFLKTIDQMSSKVDINFMGILQEFTLDIAASRLIFIIKILCLLKFFQKQQWAKVCHRSHMNQIPIYYQITNGNLL